MVAMKEALHEEMHGAGKIVGGNEAIPHSHPHQVYLFVDYLYACGGSLLCMLYV